MHYLHKILIETDGETDKNWLKQDAIDKLERFRNNVFDWAEYQTAGRWADNYPDNVILGCEDVEGLIKAIEESRETQISELKWYQENLKIDSIDEFVKDFINGTTSNIDEMQKFYLLKIAETIFGQYACDSYFYNTIDGESTINDRLYNFIRANADNLALVIIDIHS